MVDFETLIREVVLMESPDVHLQVGQPAYVRKKSGELEPYVTEQAYTKEGIEHIIELITTPEQRDVLTKELEVDFSYHMEGVGRFRVNIFQEQHGPSLAIRLIPEAIPTLEQLGFNDSIKSLLNSPRGLVLITGPTGMGKSTTLAAMVDYINQTRKDHVITIEDPIEYVHKNKLSLISQREVNAHTHSFGNAIRVALRQDPNVVMVGEMRDLETISAAMTLAETGHLVFSTLHTLDAAQTIDRVIDVFPANQQQQIRTQLSQTLKGVISQILIPRADGKGRVAAREIMLTNDAIKNCIAQNQIHQIYSMIQIGQAEGMILMDQALEQMAKAGVITNEEALAKARDVESLTQALT